MGVFVNSNYDSGNIDVINITNPRDHTIHEVELKVCHANDCRRQLLQRIGSWVGTYQRQCLCILQLAMCTGHAT
jgi:hypothetical protein